MGANYHWWLDMIFHGGYYFVITILLYIFFCKGRYKFLFWLAVLLSSYLFEALQSFVPGRTVSLLDMTSNFLGVSLATLLCSLFYR
jgi:VanZ family protein